MMVAELFASLGLKPDKGSFDKGTGLIEGVKKALGALLAIEAVKKIGEMVMGTIDLGGHLDDLRQKTGLTAESLQAYGYAAKLGGSDMDSFAAGVTKLSRTLTEAKAGSAEASTALAHAGLTSAAVTAALKSGDGLDAALQEIADKFADMPDGAKKTALAMQIFGKSGAQLIPTLNRGGDGLRELKQEARDLGVVMDESTVGAADDLGDNIDKLKMSVTGLKNQAVAALLPTLKDMVDGMLDWIRANKQLLIDGITFAVNGLIGALKILGAVVGVIVDVFQWFSEHTEIAEAALTALGSVIAAFAVEAAVEWLLAFWPLVLAVATIAAVSLGLQKLWNWIRHGTGPVQSFFHWLAGAARQAGSVIVDTWHWITDKFDTVVNGVRDGLTTVRQFFTDAADAIKRVFSDAWTAILDGLDSLGRKITNNSVLRAFNTLGGNKAINDAADAIQKMSPSRASLHEGYAKRDPSDTRDFEDWASDPANRHMDDDGNLTPAPKAYRSAASAGITSGSSSATNNVNTTINVTSSSADPKAVADLVSAKIDDHWNNAMRAAHAATGGADQ